MVSVLLPKLPTLTVSSAPSPAVPLALVLLASLASDAAPLQPAAAKATRDSSASRRGLVLLTRFLLGKRGKASRAELFAQPAVQLLVARGAGDGGQIAGAVDADLDVVEHPSAAQQDDPVGQGDGLAQVVRDEQDGALLVVLPEREELALDRPAGVHVECREWLVHEQDVRGECPGPREGDPLAHPLGQLPRPQTGRVTEVDGVEPAQRR